MSLPYQPTLNFSPLSKNHGESSTLSAELVQLTQFSFKVSLDMATITAKHKIDTIVGGGADARVNSLVEGGPLKMGPEHWLANFLTKSLDKEEFDTSSGEWRLSGALSCTRWNISSSTHSCGATSSRIGACHGNANPRG